MSHSMNKQEQTSKYSLDGAKLYKKKLENCEKDSKILEFKLNEVQINNSKALEAIK